MVRSNEVMNAKMSVIVVIYNTPKQYLKRCIESILYQSFKEIEIILVNDGSTNDVQEVCEQYARQDNRIKLIYQKNQGEAVARNVGIEHATTENITFVDSDDWIEHKMCEKLCEYIQSIKNEYDIILFNCLVDYRKKVIKNYFYPKEGLLDLEDIKQLQLQNIEKGVSAYYPPEVNVSVVWSKVYHRKFIIDHQLKFVPNVIRMPDAIFNMEALEKAKKIYVFPEYFYHYQQNAFSICQRFSKDTIPYYETYVEFVRKYIQKYHKNQTFQDILNVKIVTSIDKYLYNYFFHSDNPKKWKEIKVELEQLLKKDLYQTAMKEVKKEYLGTYQKLILKAARNGNIEMLWILKKIKEMIKGIQGKKNR